MAESVLLLLLNALRNTFQLNYVIRESNTIRIYGVNVTNKGKENNKINRRILFHTFSA